MNAVRKIVQRVLTEEMLKLEARSSGDIMHRDGRKLSIIQPYFRDGVPVDNRLDYATPLLKVVSQRTGVSLEDLNGDRYIYWLGFPHGRFRCLCARDDNTLPNGKMAAQGEVFDPAVHDFAYRHGVFPRAGFVSACTPDRKHEVYSESVRAHSTKSD
jgi:hypothetical protein